MSQIEFRSQETRQLYPVGVARQAEVGCQLDISAPFRPALKQLASFSHVIVLWWAHEHDNPADRSTLVTPLPYAPGQDAGVFASRSERRPNPIALSICPILHVDEDNGVIVVAWIDAHDGTPILDLKPYVPVTDRVRDVRVAPWFEELPTCLEDSATFDWDGFFNPQ